MAEKDTSRLLILKSNRRSDRMAQLSEIALFSLEEVGVQVRIPAWLLPVFFFFHRFFTLWLFTFYSHC